MDSKVQGMAGRATPLRYNACMTILFLHGWQSIPGGIKPTFLAQHGHEVINPKLPDDDFAEAVRIAQDEFDKHQPQAVVGSSRGGAVAMNFESGSTVERWAGLASTACIGGRCWVRSLSLVGPSTEVRKRPDKCKRASHSDASERSECCPFRASEKDIFARVHPRLERKAIVPVRRVLSLALESAL
jgi:alpha-beta hydrolase superfamily lysophospholipase